MLKNILIGSGLVVITTFIHAAAMVLSVWSFKLMRAEQWQLRSLTAKGSAVSFLVLFMFVASVVESLAWALVYLWLGAISGLEEALYFSTVTYTTLGFGDVTLPDQWRLLSALQAANGIIMFGWTTAVIVAVVHRIYFAERMNKAPGRLEETKHHV